MVKIKDLCRHRNCVTSAKHPAEYNVFEALLIYGYGGILNLNRL